MENNYEKILKRSLKGLLAYKWELLGFELFYTFLVSFLFRPFINLTINLFGKLAGYPILLNKDIASFLTSISGLIAILIILYVSVIVVYFEFSVLLIILKSGMEDKKISLIEAIERGLLRVYTVSKTNIIGFSVYILALIPLLNIGLKSSLVPELNIPKFITGEIEKYPGGSLLILVGLIGLIFIFAKLFFVLPIMVFEEKSFKYARRKSHEMTKKRILKLAIIAILTSIIWANIAGLPLLILKNTTSSLTQIIKGFSRLSLFIFTVLVSPFMLSIILSIYLHYNRDFKDFNSNHFQSIDRYLDQFSLRLGKLKEGLFEKLRSLAAFIKNNRLAKLALLLVIIPIILNLAFGIREIEKHPDTLIIGHRGSLDGVENTIEAIKNADKQGADYAEMDILLSKDSVPVVIHDSNLRRLAGKNLNVYDMNYEDLREVKLKSRGYTGYVPSLRELFFHTKNKPKLLIEIKTHGRETEDVVKKTIQVVDEYNARGDVIFHTAEYPILLELNKYEDLTVGYVVIGKLGKLTTKKLAEIPADFLVFEDSIVDRKLIKRAHLVDKPVFAWTVNSYKRAEELIYMNVDGIITDHPRLMNKALDEVEKNRSLDLNKKQ